MPGLLRSATARTTVWIDVDNPPQVQYLVPFGAAFRARGANVVLTARAYGNAVDLLEQQASPFVVVGKEFGASRTAKMSGVLRRAAALRSLFEGRRERPNALLCASRSSAIAARSMRIPSYVIADYEYANSSTYRFTRSIILYPDVIDPAPLLKSGVRREQLIPFRGLKEDISFADIDIEGIAPYSFSSLDDELVRVLFRPPSEKSHYYNPASRRLALETLEHLAAQPNAVVIFSPRHAWQADELQRLSWQNDPVVLSEAVPFVELLKGVDLVISSGGTMLREAAYLGLPAYSIFKSRIGGVDRYLESIGRVRVIGSPEALPAIELTKAAPLAPLRSNPRLLEELAEIVLPAARTATSATVPG